MKLYLFERIEKASAAYHEEGGIVIIAHDKEDAIGQIAEMEYTHITDEEWEIVQEYDLAKDYPTQVFIFPDAGCC